MTQRDLKKTAVFLLMIPLLIVSYFAVGELSAGQPGAEIHLVQMSPLILLMVFTWYYPTIAGMLLVGLGILMGLAYLFIAGRLPIGAIVLTEGLIFLPLILAGISCMMVASLNRHRPHA